VTEISVLFSIMSLF